MIDAAIETIAAPNAWTKGAYARTAKGRVIGPSCQNAQCFCIQGALIRADPEQHWRLLNYVYQAIVDLFPQRAPCGTIPIFNDHPDTTHEDVLLVLRRARELKLAAGLHNIGDVIALNVQIPPDTPISIQAHAAQEA